MIASGQSYRTKSEKEPEEFNSIRTLQWLVFEQFKSASETIGAWNMQVQYWLKYYIYLRLVDRKKRGLQIIPLIMTNFVSAFWHGFYIGFYVFFFGLFLTDFLWK